MCSLYACLWLLSPPTLKWMRFGVEFLKYIYIYIYISLEIWGSVPYGDFLPPKKKLEHMCMIPRGGVPPKIIPT
jgi:hypothetical protein